MAAAWRRPRRRDISPGVTGVSVEVIFQIGGRTIRLDQFVNPAERITLEMLQERMEESVGSMRCANHGTALRVVVSCESLNQVRLSVVEACCEEFKDAVEAKLEEEVFRRTIVTASRTFCLTHDGSTRNAASVL